FSFVSDHFQYLASAGIITLVAAGAATLIARLKGFYRTAGSTVCVILLATLAALTWRHSQLFVNAEACYRATIARNPDCATAHTNLAGILLQQGRVAEAIEQDRRALALEPENALVHFNLSAALLQKGELGDATFHLQRALEIDPN